MSRRGGLESTLNTPHVGSVRLFDAVFVATMSEKYQSRFQILNRIEFFTSCVFFLSRPFEMFRVASRDIIDISDMGILQMLFVERAEEV